MATTYIEPQTKAHQQLTLETLDIRKYSPWKKETKSQNFNCEIGWETQGAKNHTQLERKPFKPINKPLLAPTYK